MVPHVRTGVWSPACLVSPLHRKVAWAHACGLTETCLKRNRLAEKRTFGDELVPPVRTATSRSAILGHLAKRRKRAMFSGNAAVNASLSSE